ncbi:MAG: hypothetical protein AAF211_32030, partial [Myxococcota bacterium]
PATMAALRAFDAVGRVDGSQWVHAVFHHRDDVRRAAVQAMPGDADLPQWTLLPLLADSATADAVEARLLQQSLSADSVAYLLRIMDREGAELGRDLALRCFASVDWRHQIAQVLQAIPSDRALGLGKGERLPVRLKLWEAAHDDLDELVRSVFQGVARGEDSARQILDGWLTNVAAGGATTDAERRLAISMLSQHPRPPEAMGLALLAFPELVDEGDPVEVWPGLAPYARVVSGTVSSAKRPGFFERFPIPELDVDGLAGLVRLVGTGALSALLRHPDVPRARLLEAMVEAPAASARLLAVPLTARRDRSARRELLVDVLAARGAQAAELMAHAAVEIPHSQLSVLDARPPEWPDDTRRALLQGVVRELITLDLADRVRERRTRQLADLPWLQTGEVLDRVLADGRSGLLVHRLVTRIVQSRGAEVVTVLSGAALERLVTLDRDEGALPWAIQQELAKSLRNHGHSAVQAWAAEALAPVEVAMSRMAETQPGRRLTEAEVVAIQSATPKQLAAALAPALAGRVRGLVEALGERKPVPSIEACLALLLCGDRLESVARLLEEY